EWNGGKRAVYITRLDKPVTPFAGTPMNEKTFKFYGNTDEIIYGSNEPGARYMYVTTDQLPVRFGTYTVYNLTIDQKYVYVKQSEETNYAAQMLIVQDGVVIGGRNDFTYEANPFTAKYQIHSKVVIFTTFYGDDAHLELLVVKNPLYHGDWRP
ncbi:MAG: hypothetical protein QHH10_14505, partial [Peptococcaceae bacterium]|nr:hypothetical protein [Peptococcaceae bacterium]